MDCARNIITANFSGGTSATTAPLWQWDYGQVLCITGIDLPAAFEVHFSTNRTGGASTVAVGADGQVTIPNMLLTIGKNLNAWIYLSDAQGEGETEYSILIPVKARPMPETYDAEVTGEFDDVVRQVSEYAETAQTAADNAGASASAAATSASEAAASASAAESAKTAAETAQGEAEDAQTAAETAAQTASEKAQQSAQDAAQAAQSKADAESSAGRAEAAETGAESAKTNAETAAQGAAASASAASASASSAGQAAISAGQSATAAAGSATTAENAAQTATTKAGEASASASAAAASETAAQTAQTGAETAASTATASATTATTKAAEAAQSASGAAQSKADAEAAATRAEQAAETLTVDSALSDSSVNPVQNKVITGEVTQLKSHLEATYITDTASGAIASFADGSDGIPVESLMVTMEPIQDLHGQDAPYPAGGGKNLCDLDGYLANTQAVYTESGDIYTIISNADMYNNPIVFSDTDIQVTCSVASFTNGTTTNARIDLIRSDGTVVGGLYADSTSTFTSTTASKMRFNWSSPGTFSISKVQIEKGLSATTYAPYSNICPISGRQSVTVTRTGKNLFDASVLTEQSLWKTVKLSLPPGTYTMSTSKPDNNIPLYFCLSSDFTLGSTTNVFDTHPVTRIIPDGDTAEVVFRRISGDDVFSNYWFQIEEGSTPTSYAPYDGTSVTIQLGQTVYGGTVDVTTGTMTVDRAMVDLGSLTWMYREGSSIGDYFYVNFSGIKYAGSFSNTAYPILTSMYKTTARSSDFVNDCVCVDGVQSQQLPSQVQVKDSRYTDAATFKTAMDGVQFCYELAAPIEITLDPATLSTLKGDNNVWSDGDSVEMTYIADPKLYIARLTEPDADMVADANITSGSYFMVGNNLYLATSNIASGATIVPDVNCTRTNLASALNAINS